MDIPSDLDARARYQIRMFYAETFEVVKIIDKI